MIENKGQFGFPGLEIQGITIHNTGNELSAEENYDWMKHTTSSQGTHFFVDGDEIIQAMPLDWCVYHTGMGIDWACKHTIAIEICHSMSHLDTYLNAERKAVELVKRLMDEYHIPRSRIYFHNDFNRKTYCPHRALELYGSKKEFVRGYF